MNVSRRRSALRRRAPGAPQPIYRGSEAVPRAVTLTARGSRGFRLDVVVLNKAG
ncbi:MAG: hypothetical protein M3N07_09165 [Pseudomonadota bacterium]|nr:hypothetical protein [Pseudomonadota bacterium]